MFLEFRTPTPVTNNWESDKFDINITCSLHTSQKNNLLKMWITFVKSGYLYFFWRCQYPRSWVVGVGWNVSKRV